MSSERKMLLAVCSLAAACGNYSNDDLEFINALPHHENLSVHIPQSGTGQSGSALQSQQQHLDNADAGCTQTFDAESCFYTGTVSASISFNDTVFNVLEFIDGIGAIAPTSRTPDARIWGPVYPVDNEPGFDVRVMISRAPPDVYAFAMQFHHHDDPTDNWFSFLDGGFVATGGARHGDGGFILDAQGARAFGLLTPTLGGLDFFEADYNTDSDPIHVNLDAKGSTDAGEVVTVAYRYIEHPDSGVDGGIDSAALHYILSIPNVTLDIMSAWEGDGRGQGLARIVAGPQNELDAGDVECWGPQFTFTTDYIFQSWAGGIDQGDAGACPPDISALFADLPPLPASLP
jgi:hypothetical protein